MQERFHSFTILITKINRCIHKIKAMEMLGYDIKGSHVSCLYYLYKAKSLTATELCDICAEDKASMSRTLDYLEKNGFISCESNAKKRYKAVLSLTEKGVKTGEEIAKKIDAVLGVSSDGLTVDERNALYHGLEVICANLEKICESY